MPTGSDPATAFDCAIALVVDPIPSSIAATVATKFVTVATGGTSTAVSAATSVGMLALRTSAIGTRAYVVIALASANATVAARGAMVVLPVATATAADATLAANAATFALTEASLAASDARFADNDATFAARNAALAALIRGFP